MAGFCDHDWVEHDGTAHAPQVMGDDLDQFGAAVAALLADPDRAEWMGDNARERVRDAFLGPRHLTQYVDLFEGVWGTTEAGRGAPPMRQDSGPGKLRA